MSEKDFENANGHTWYDIIKNDEIVTGYYNKKIAIDRAKKLKADYVMKVIDFEPIEIVYEKEV